MMTTQWTLRIELSGYWHAGTGRADVAGADAVVYKDPEGLPAVGGHHLKGLVRHNLRLLESAGRVETGMTDRLFGKGTQGASPDPSKTRFGTTEGKVRFGSARLAPSWQAYARSEEGKAGIAHLYRTVNATRLEDGVAAGRTLRMIEVAVPLTLTSTVTFLDDLTASEQQALRWGVGLVRAVGKHRTRGLGRARLRFAEGPAA